MSGGGYTKLADPLKSGVTPIGVPANPLSVTTGFSLPEYDYIAVTYPVATQEVYTYKLGGLSGATVGIVTITYTDSSKESLLSVEKT